jgi:hypothetical protein
VGREVIQGLRDVQIKVNFEARDVEKGKEGTEDTKLEEQFFFLTLSV